MVKLYISAPAPPAPSPEPEVFLRLVKRGNNIKMLAMDQNGRELATLITIYPNGTIYRNKVGRRLLERLGFKADCGRISEDYHG